MGVALIALTAVSLASPTPGARAATTSQRLAFQIVIRADRTVLRVTDQSIARGIVRAQHELGCLKGVLSITDRTAEQTLAGEVATQYAAIALGPVFDAGIAEQAQAEALPLPRRLLRSLAANTAILRRVRTIRACADFRRWRAHGFARLDEPIDTRLAAGAIAAPPLFPAVAAIVTPGERITLRRADRRAVAHVKQLTRLVVASVTAWALAVDASFRRPG
jgi:hypothetical protein